MIFCPSVGLQKGLPCPSSTSLLSTWHLLGSFVAFSGLLDPDSNSAASEELAAAVLLVPVGFDVVAAGATVAARPVLRPVSSGSTVVVGPAAAAIAPDAAISAGLIRQLLAG